MTSAVDHHVNLAQRAADDFGITVAEPASMSLLLLQQVLQDVEPGIQRCIVLDRDFMAIDQRLALVAHRAAGRVIHGTDAGLHRDKCRQHFQRALHRDLVERNVSTAPPHDMMDVSRLKRADQECPGVLAGECFPVRPRDPAPGVGPVMRRQPLCLDQRLVRRDGQRIIRQPAARQHAKGIRRVRIGDRAAVVGKPLGNRGGTIGAGNGMRRVAAVARAQQQILVADELPGIEIARARKAMSDLAQHHRDLPGRGVVDIAAVMDVDAFGLQVASRALLRLQRVVAAVVDIGHRA